MGVNNYQTILRVELNDRMCYSRHHLMVPENFYCWVAGSFNKMLAERPLAAAPGASRAAAGGRSRIYWVKVCAHSAVYKVSSGSFLPW